MTVAEHSSAALERTLSGLNDPTFVRQVQDSVRRICRASAVVLEIIKHSSALQPPPDAESDDAIVLAHDLVTFAAEQGRINRMHIAQRHDRQGVPFRFVLVPLSLHDEVFGACTLAIAESQWDDLTGREICESVGALVSLLVADFCSKTDLEIDLIDMQRRIDRMTRRAETDPLTLVENKASFEKKAQARLSVSSGAVALLVLDVDNFKKVNDIFGHQFGDNYLRNVAVALQRTCPSGTLIGRIGGDEFCVLLELPSSTQSFLDSIDKQLRAFLQRGAALMGKPELARVSIGVAIFPMQALDYHSLFSAADAALYASKRSGRNTTTTYNAAMKALLRHRDFAEYFFRSLEEERIVAHFQPIIDLTSRRCVGYEALARWHDAANGIMTPKSFEAVFQDYRMASALSVRIIGNALDNVRKLPGFYDNEAATLWFNLTRFDLVNPEFVFEMQSALSRNRLNWDRVVIELTERVMLGERSGQVYRSLEEIRRRGGRVAFDDFGTGHAGLLHVKDWPVDIIKIDRSFTSEIGISERDRIVVQALLQIASSMGQDVVAEGIETAEQLETLVEMGCRYGQGFLFAEPRSALEFAEAPARYDVA